ncbi:MAG: arginase [Paracoccus sp. (in: a-proteobacteria)]|jgi:arginase|uniref:arginase n=2 Tax=Paracoccus TaxID=265 RepID=UPI000C6B2E67|nr:MULTISPECIES: arginase [unclassified Paracoccus (in: a-proteobacteria)]MBA49289.1 arginase [Paracoccus sp. (in: a-proteobacteria)]MDB2552177.1 arginase [Paracoccus sp. (in: a-proteobacteria)]HIC65591.1 arginase [Paracoccus sp. (in: a-proteobacteria)]|tara:strand:+ start:1238 stop:2161 length:924 start_codon:yes stop_codon:yes gene_type:complete
MTHCILIGAPVDEGQRRPGCLMGPAAYRTAGLAGTLTALGHTIEDRGDVVPDRPGNETCANAAVHHLPETIAWTNALREAVAAALPEGMPIIMGGDHSLALGSVAGVAAHAAQTQRPQFVIWLDAHSDFHTLRTTTTGNLHGTPMAYASGLPGFGPFPPFPAPIPGENICMFGIRSVDPAEHAAMQDTEITVNDMRVLDEQGIVAPLRAFLNRVRATGGLLHVSLDVDFLDPSIAPAVGTTVPGGTTFREAHLVMELLHESGLVTSLDLVELNPFLDDRGRTAKLMVDLVGSLMGRKVFDRPTRSYG